MITVTAATEIILDHLFNSAITPANLPDCTGKVLAEAVVADRDFPAFHRVSMDGIAILYRDWEAGKRTFSITGTQAAGEQQKTLPPGGEHCLEVMTGAMLPAGCDVVVRYEDIEVASGKATITADVISPWQSIHQQAADARKGEVLLEPGHRIAPSEVALLASVGKAQVNVFAFPKVAIISTGDELVDIDATPSAWQIRRSNSYALQSSLREMGGDGTCFHLQDEKSAMETSLAKIVEDFDVLILSGGVSKGKFDFVPAVLESIGIRKLFHQVSQRPGKPFWFGTGENGKIAFALPGNPVSTFMCFYRYVEPWIRSSMGAPVRQRFAILGRDFSFHNPLTCFLQVSVEHVEGKTMAYPVPGGGSGDFANLKKVSGFLELPLEKTDFKAGEVYPYISFRQ